MFEVPKTPRASLCLGLAVALTFIAAAPASAQGLLDAIFGALSGRPQASVSPTAYADPNNDGHRDGSRAARAPGRIYGGGTSYCVRLCDGRFFPIQRHANATPAQLCGTMCPAARTKIFSGSEINRAVAPDGSRYADLDNAFTYRERVVDNCTCNGKDAFGLAPMDVNNDPTLRTGDIVATTGGLMAYTAPPKSRRAAEAPAANFTPVDTSHLTRDLRERLANVTVAGQN